MGIPGFDSRSPYNCCKGCTPETGRTSCNSEGHNCHTYCERFLRAKAENEAFMKAVSAASMDEHIINGYIRKRRKAYKLA